MSGCKYLGVKGVNVFNEKSFDVFWVSVGLVVVFIERCKVGVRSVRGFV